MSVSSVSRRAHSARRLGLALGIAMVGLCSQASAGLAAAPHGTGAPPSMEANPLHQPSGGLRPVQPQPTTPQPPLSLKLKYAESIVVETPQGTAVVTKFVCEGDGSGCPIRYPQL